MTKQQILFMIHYARSLLILARSIPSLEYEKQAWKVIREIEKELAYFNQNKAA